jgi:hypothetical protein
MNLIPLISANNENNTDSNRHTNASQSADAGGNPNGLDVSIAKTKINNESPIKK